MSGSDTKGSIGVACRAMVKKEDNMWVVPGKLKVAIRSTILQDEYIFISVCYHAPWENKKLISQENSEGINSVKENPKPPNLTRLRLLDLMVRMACYSRDDMTSHICTHTYVFVYRHTRACNWNQCLKRALSILHASLVESASFNLTHCQCLSTQISSHVDPSHRSHSRYAAR